MISGGSANEVNGSIHSTLNGTETVTLALNSSPNHLSGSNIGDVLGKKPRIIENKDGEIVISDASGIETATENDDGTTTITLPGDLFANYSQTMWDRDSDGNKISVQVIKQESSLGQDLLTHAIKAEQGKIEKTENGNIDIQTITIPGGIQTAASSIQQPIIVNSLGAAVGGGEGTIILQPSTNPRVIVEEDAPIPRSTTSQLGKQNGNEERPHVCDE